jgi:hypothetical protein
VTGSKETRKARTTTKVPEAFIHSDFPTYVISHTALYSHFSLTCCVRHPAFFFFYCFLQSVGVDRNLSHVFFLWFWLFLLLPLNETFLRSRDVVLKILQMATEHFIIQLMHTTWKRRVIKTYWNYEGCSNMFRFTRKPSPGSHNQYLTKNTGLVQCRYRRRTDVVSVMAAYVSTLNQACIFS